MSLLAVSDLEARHGLLQAVRGISFAVDAGETVALVGANGAGKTTLLRTIAGAHPASAGTSAWTASTSPTWRRTGGWRKGWLWCPKGGVCFRR